MLLLVAGAVLSWPATAQDAATALTHNYQSILDNADVQIVHVHYDGHEELAEHDHSHYPTVYVYLSNSGPVRFSHDEAKPFALTRRPVKAGWFRVSPGRFERHEVANLGASASDSLRVECKRIPLGQPGFEYRFASDIDLTRTRATTEFSSPDIVVRRFVVAAGGAEPVSAEMQPQLLIAFAPTVVRQAGRPDWTMSTGTVLWVKAGASLTLSAPGAAAAHALTIRLLH